MIKSSWAPGDTREVDCKRLDLQINVEYDSYRRVYIADGHEWAIAGRITKEDGRQYYIVECLGPAGEAE